MISIFQNYGGTLLYGLGQTLLCSLIALFFALIIGSAFAILEVFPNKFLRVISRVYIELFRNIPLLVITMFFYVVIPMYVVEISGFVSGTIGLTLYSSAFIAETVRSGIQSVDPGQWKAPVPMDSVSGRQCATLFCHRLSDTLFHHWVTSLSTWLRTLQFLPSLPALT